MLDVPTTSALQTTNSSFKVHISPSADWFFTDLIVPSAVLVQWSGGESVFPSLHGCCWLSTALRSLANGVDCRGNSNGQNLTRIPLTFSTEFKHIKNIFEVESHSPVLRPSQGKQVIRPPSDGAFTAGVGMCCVCVGRPFRFCVRVPIRRPTAPVDAVDFDDRKVGQWRPVTPFVGTSVDFTAEKGGFAYTELLPRLPGVDDLSVNSTSLCSVASLRVPLFSLSLLFPKGIRYCTQVIFP